MSRPEHEVTDQLRREIEAYAAVGVPHANIGSLVGLSEKTLRKHYHHELTVGKAKANAQVAKTLFRQAMDGNIAAAIFWLKAQANWSERVTMTGADGGPIQVEKIVREVVRANS